MANCPPRLALRNVSKSFTMHLRGGAVLPVVSGVTFEARSGECVALGGPSGIGKSSILKMIFGNYRADHGQILIADDDGDHVLDIASAAPRDVLRARQTKLGYVSQFLRVIPRVSAREIVASAAREDGLDSHLAYERAESLLARLNLPNRLWHLPPATFSGGEQQRVNIARGFAARRDIVLLDEPTAALDAVNRDVVVALMGEAKARGATLLGIFHDDDVRARVADRTVDVSSFAARTA
jgi:alpha-D-ribose 1-methylphosphonate 5-triphosphate synthase subunit PhnL